MRELHMNDKGAIIIRFTDQSLFIQKYLLRTLCNYNGEQFEVSVLQSSKQYYKKTILRITVIKVKLM